MRISDWSSDVCSSDLIDRQSDRRAGGRSNTRQAAARRARIDVGRGRLDGGRRGAAVAVRAASGSGGARDAAALDACLQVGRASCRERVCQFVYVLVVPVSVTNKTKQNQR